MRIAVPFAILVLGLVVTAGCVGSPGTGTPTEPSPASPGTPASVEYVIAAGEIPASFAYVNVTMQAVFVETTADLGPCYPEIYEGPYKPTITPLATPTRECHRSAPVTIDLTTTEHATLGPLAVPDSVTGHALVLTGIEAELATESGPAGIKGSGGTDLIAEPTRPSGQYGIQIGINTTDGDAPYDYYLTTTEFEPPHSE